MKWLKIVCALLLYSLNSYCQNFGKSNLYLETGQLKADTTLRISTNQYNLWVIAENKIIRAIYAKTKYSALAKDAGITGKIIVAFECDTDKIKNITVVSKRLGGGLEESVIEGFTLATTEILQSIIQAQDDNLVDKYAYIGKYYMPFEFSLININHELENKGAIPIIDMSTILIGSTPCILRGTPPTK